MSPTVAVLATGGTIASTDTGAGATPTRAGGELIEAVPELADHAEITVEEIAQTPSYEMGFRIPIEIRKRARELAPDVDGVVVTQGTDTMEETAYLLDLLADYEVPVVLTGAQRRDDEVSADGPANLLAAVRTAVHEAFADGVYIAFNEEVHAARDVTKAHTSKLEAFESPERGSIATLSRETVRLHRDPGSETPTLPVTDLSASVSIVDSGLGADATALERVLSGGTDGIVLRATGLGNVAADLGEAIPGIIDRGIPIVVASRCHAGSTGAVYATPGGGATLRDHGAIFAGDLRPHKTRLKLICALSQTDDPDEIRPLFEGER